MESLHTFKVRDTRRAHYFTIDNVFIDEYLKILGPTAYAVYSYLCRCSDKNQESFPKQAAIAEKIGLNEQTVNEKLQLLHEWNIIQITHTREKETGKQMNNIYTLIDRSEWKKPDIADLEKPSQSIYGNSKSASSGSRHGNSKSAYIYKKTTKPIEKIFLENETEKAENLSEDFQRWKENKKYRKQKKTSRPETRYVSAPSNPRFPKSSGYRERTTADGRGII